MQQVYRAAQGCMVGVRQRPVALDDGVHHNNVHISIVDLDAGPQPRGQGQVKACEDVVPFAWERMEEPDVDPVGQSLRGRREP